MVKQKYILSIDQGTTGTTLSLVHQEGFIVGSVNREFQQHFPKPGWVEHNPEQIWQSVLDCVQQLFEKTRVKGSDVVAIGITNQRETVVCWDKKSGRSLYNAIVWQCRRTTEDCVKLKTRGYEKLIKKKTGLLLDPYFSGTKIKWLIKNSSEIRQKQKKGQALFGTIDCYLLWKLTGGRSYKTDPSNASRTLLFNIDKAVWDDELLKLFGVSSEALPEVSATNSFFGATESVPGLLDGTPIYSLVGDQQSALFGQACFNEGEAKCTYGTGSFILLNTGQQRKRSSSGMLSTVAWQLEGQKLQYALEGGAFICGAAVQWLRDGLGIIPSSSHVESLASEVSDSGGVQFVPAFVGLGSPHWRPEARGVITGLTRGTTRSHVARATLESMAWQNVDILMAMEKDLGKKIKKLKVDGGASANNLLLQMQSDFLRRRIYRPKMIETTSLGAAYLAGLGVGFWASLTEVSQMQAIEREFEPQISPSQRRQRHSQWLQAVKKSY